MLLSIQSLVCSALSFNRSEVSSNCVADSLAASSMASPVFSAGPFSQPASRANATSAAPMNLTLIGCDMIVSICKQSAHHGGNHRPFAIGARWPVGLSLFSSLRCDRKRQWRRGDNSPPLTSGASGLLSPLAGKLVDRHPCHEIPVKKSPCQKLKRTPTVTVSRSVSLLRGGTGYLPLS